MKKIYTLILAAVAAASLTVSFPSCSLIDDGSQVEKPGQDNPGEETPGDDKPDDPSAKELTVELSTSLITADGTSYAEIKVFLDSEQVTEDVKIYDMYTNKPVSVPDLKFTSTTPGNYTFWASYKTYVSKSFTITAISSEVPDIPADTDPSNTSFARRVLIVDYTGTGCGYCPYMVSLLHNFGLDEKNSDRYLLAACHSFNETDPSFFKPNLDGAMGVSGYPTLVLDMNSGKRFSNYQSLSAFQSVFDAEYAAEKAQCGIAVANVLDGNQLVINISIKAAVSQEYRVAAMVLEDGIKAKQSNYGAAKIDGLDFDVHNHSIRAICGQRSSVDFSGNSLTIGAGETAEEFFIVTLDDAWNAENLNVIVYVTTEKNKSFTVNNAVACPLNGSVSYSYAN